MSGFDFRDMLGGAPAQVQPDDDLADGASADDAAGLHWHLTSKRPGIDRLVELVARTVIYQANANTLCTAALLALVVERVAQIAFRELPEPAATVQRAHIVAEVGSMIKAIAGGERG